MSFDVTSIKLIGNPDSSGWSQAYDFKPDDPNKILKRGCLFAVISTSSHDEGLDIVVAGREVLARLHEEYFGKLEETPFIALKNAVEKIIDEFSSWKSVEIAALSIVDSTVYIAAGGGASSCLFRSGGLFELVNSEDNQTIAGSGKPRLDDKILLGSKSFFDTFLKEKTVELLENKESSLFIESLAPFVHSQDKEGNIGLLLVQFNDKIKDGEFNAEEIRSVLNNKKNEPTINKTNSGFKRGLGDTKRRVFGIFEKVGKKGIFLKEKKAEQQQRKSKKTSFLVGILLLIILSVSILFGVDQKKKADLKASYESQLTSAEHELQESYNLYLLNPQRSRELFNQARDKIMNLSSEGVDDPKLDELIKKVGEGEENILGQYSAAPELFVDLELFSEGFVVDSVASSADAIYILDKSSEKIVEVSLINKRTEIYAGPSEVEDSNSIAAYSGRVFVAGSDGLYELDSGRIEIDETNQENVLIGSYAGNLYVLDKTTSRIYRYPATDTGFGTKKDWLTDGVDEDLSNARSMVIDGTIWVLVGEDTLLKFSLGNTISFGFKGVFPEIEKITNIYTDEDSEYLYVLEKDKGRVVVTNKDGEYEAQYLDDGIKDASKVVVSEKEKKIFLLTSDKILSSELKHLD